MTFATNGRVELYYESFGDLAGPVVLLVNGLGSQCISFTDEGCRLLVDEGLGVVRFDNRDVGLSTKLDTSGSTPPYTLSDMAADAVAVLDRSGISRAHAVGFSMGGAIVQLLAIEHPDRLASLTSVMSTTGDRDVGHGDRRALEALIAPPPTDRAGYIDHQVAVTRVYGSPDHFDARRVAGLAGAAYDRCFCPEGKARQGAAAAAAASRSPKLRYVRVPALVLHGDRDPLIDASGGRRTAEAIPGARIQIIEGMAHDYPPPLWQTIVGLVAAHVHQVEAGLSAP